MFMRKIKFKILILLMCFISINQYSLNVFADTPSDDIPSVNTPSTENTNSPTNKNNSSTVLDGEIGEWDPTLDDNPDFNNPELDEIDGHIPTENEYYTISVTVPLNMEFMVLPNSQSAFGNFYSPVYTIKNNGSKNISVKINSFDREENTEIYDRNTVPLYVEELNSEDDRTQIELRMCAIEDLDTSMRRSKEIDLTKLQQLNSTAKELYVLSANEKKGVTFEAEEWELPKGISKNKKAVSNFNARFVFSIVEE